MSKFVKGMKSAFRKTKGVQLNPGPVPNFTKITLNDLYNMDRRAVTDVIMPKPENKNV